MNARLSKEIRRQFTKAKARKLRKLYSNGSKDAKQEILKWVKLFK